MFLYGTVWSGFAENNVLSIMDLDITFDHLLESSVQQFAQKVNLAEIAGLLDCTTCSSQHFYAVIVIAGNIDGMKELLAKNDGLDVDSIDSVSNIWTVQQDAS